MATRYKILHEGNGLKLDQTTSQTIINGQPVQDILTASEIVATDANKKLQTLAVATYPSLTELSYVKGVTSGVQSQLNGKLGTALTSANIFVGNGSNIATGIALTGDATLSNAGVLGVNKTRLNVRNETGSTIVSTKVVYVSGFNNFPLIALADNTDEAKHGVVGVTIAPITHEANGFIATDGQFDAETNSWTVGTTLYLSTAGALTSTMPTSGAVKVIGVVTVQANYPTGKILLTERQEEHVLAGGSATDLILRMGDTVGVNKTSFRDYANTEVAYINSDGAIYSGGVLVPTISDISTFTNKRITARVQSVTDAATITPNADNDDCVDITAIAQAFTIANPSGTPTNFQKLIVRILDNGTARAITFGNSYVASGVSLPTTTIVSTTMVLTFIYNTANSLNKWQLIESNQFWL